MLLYSLLKTQHFAIPLFLVVLRNDDQTWEVKGKKRTSEYRRKINGLKALKN